MNDQREWNALNETDDFFSRHQQIEALREEIGLMALATKRLRQYGANEKYFRHEKEAHALAGKKMLSELGWEEDEYCLRLYCIRWTSEIVVLLNGGCKTAQSAQQCPNVSNHFDFANQVAHSLDEMRRQEDLILNYNRLTLWDGSNIELDI